MQSIELAIAWRYLRSRRGSRLLSLISMIAIGGVLVGVSALILIMGVMKGLQTDLREKILVGSPDLRVLPYGADMRMSDWATVREKVLRVPGAVKAAPFITTQGLARNMAGYQTGAQVVGILPADSSSAAVTTIRTHAILGDFSFRRDSIALPGAVLGKLLASKLNAFPGDTIVLFGAAGLEMNAATGALIPRADSLVVSGVFETGMYEYDDAYLYVDLRTAQRFGGYDGDVTGIEVQASSRWTAPALADSIRARVDAPVHVMDWQEQNQSLFQALKLEKLGMAVILLLIVVVAAFNIVSTLTMMVVDKTREIGILRAMGLSALAVRRVFLLQGIFVGAAGTLGGTALGLFLAMLLERYHLISLDPSVYFIDHLPVRIEVLDVLSAIAGSMIIATVATWHPASQAARLDPVEAIRHE